MAFHETYRKQVALLIRILPLIAEESCFALKGGTAINLFLRDMPRLSVDIDLTYLPVAPRAESLAAIDAAMKRITGRIREAIPDAKITSSGSEGAITQLIVRQSGVQNCILRRSLCRKNRCSA
jgi:DNA polymerase sigma